MQTRNMEKSENNHQFKIIFNYDIFDKYFFNYDAKRKGTYQMKDKRLWNFLLFAFKVKNESNALSSAQIEKMQTAHDGDLTKADCKYLFDELKEIIYG